MTTELTYKNIKCLCVLGLALDEILAVRGVSPSALTTLGAPHARYSTDNVHIPSQDASLVSIWPWRKEREIMVSLQRSSSLLRVALKTPRKATAAQKAYRMAREGQ